jgi:hypothetical protein
MHLGLVDGLIMNEPNSCDKRNQNPIRTELCRLITKNKAAIDG